MSIESSKRRVLTLCPARKMKLQAASSKYPFKYSPPRSRKMKRKNAQTDCSNLKALQAKYAIDNTYQEEMYQQANSDRVEKSLKEVWQMDKECNEFSQIK